MAKTVAVGRYFDHLQLLTAVSGFCIPAASGFGTPAASGFAVRVKQHVLGTTATCLRWRNGTAAS